MHKYFLAIMILLLTPILSFAAGRDDLVGLCYHQVEPKASGKFSLSTEKFRAQLQYLKNHNFVSLNSDDLENIYLKGSPMPANAILITFDDGYKTVFDYALPIMQEFGFKGVVCIYPSFIGAGKAMSWQQLKRLLELGWSVESHSMTHANLASKADQPMAEEEFFKKEIVAPKQIIETKLGNHVKFMVWPYGCYTTRTIEAAKKAGYIGALTVDGGATGKTESPFQIKRQVVYASDDMNKFLIRLGMRAIKIDEHHPAPGLVTSNLATFSCRLPELTDYSPEKFVLNAKLTGHKTTFSFDPQTRILSGTISGEAKPGNHFFDVYLRDKKTGITGQHGWLFTVSGGKTRNSY